MEEHLDNFRSHEGLHCHEVFQFCTEPYRSLSKYSVKERNMSLINNMGIRLDL